jgi:hypothetical protein
MKRNKKDGWGINGRRGNWKEYRKTGERRDDKLN